MHYESVVSCSLIVFKYVWECGRWLADILKSGPRNDIIAATEVHQFDEPKNDHMLPFFIPNLIRSSVVKKKLFETNCASMGVKSGRIPD